MHVQFINTWKPIVEPNTHHGVKFASMARSSQKSKKLQPLYERVPISQLLKGRRGKHNDLILGVLHDLSTLPIDEAMRIPLKKSDGVSLSNLRSAISRAARIRKIKIRTYSDSDYLYLWKTESAQQVGGSRTAAGSRSSKDR